MLTVDLALDNLDTEIAITPKYKLVSSTRLTNYF